MRRTRRNLARLTAVVLTAAACTTVPTADSTQPTLPGGVTPPPEAVQMAGALVDFDSCDAFLEYMIDHAVELVGPYGLEQQDFWPFWGRDFLFEGDVALSAAGEAGAAARDFSGTNVQVEGVDEPDIVKTDGERIVVIANNELIVVDVDGESPQVEGRLSLGRMPVQTLFLSGDRVLMFGSAWSHHPIPLLETDDAFAPEFWSTPTIQIVEVDIADDPEVVRTMTIDGSFISGRMIGDTARLVMTSGPVGFEWAYPEGSGLRAEREAIEANREIVRNSEPENWIPYFLITDGEGSVTAEGDLFDCERAAHPDEFSGLDMLSVVTIDLGQGLDVIDSAAVVATGQTVYSSSESLYVATQNWQTARWLEDGGDEPDGQVTEIHKFDIGDPDRTTYLSSGEVAGYLLNQFAMDEHMGDLRVASTTSPGRGASSEPESRVTVLREFGDNLVPIGIVDGLGVTEQIYSVRFMGDVGYVVTFRQTDPLYTIDLSDHNQPKMVGELKIPGFSSYLHPLSDNLLMGVGQDATEDGRVLGTQVSVFDVSDLENPRRIDTYTLNKGSHSEIEYDHHAFLYWDGLAMVPFQQWWWDDENEGVMIGALGLAVSDDGRLSLMGTISHPGSDDWDYAAQIQRSIVIGDSVYTVAPGGVMKSSLDDLSQEAFLDF